ncbi:ABC transporter permease [Nitrincola sp.]|uniref:ABC transporter permease n=1 Tax=Nitrincola sp. TaxID=1926584 RepID=UPI003A8F3F8E
MKHTDLKRYPGFRLITWVCLTVLYAPMLVLAVYSFNSVRSITHWSGFTFDWYLKVFQNPSIQKATLNSLTIASTAAFTATLVALLAALALVMGKPFRGRTATLTFINFPIMVPEIIVGIASLLFFIAINFQLGMQSILIAHTVFCIPFAFLPIYSRVKSIERYYSEAAQDLYASQLACFRLVIFPMILPGIVSGFLLAFIVSLDDFIITNMVAGPGSTTLPLTIYSMVRVGFTPEINALSTLLLLVSIILVSLVYLINRRSTPKT